MTADEMCASVTQDARHVPHELRRRAYTFFDTERSEFLGRIAQSLLRAIRECREKMTQQSSFDFSGHLEICGPSRILFAATIGPRRLFPIRSRPGSSSRL